MRVLQSTPVGGHFSFSQFPSAMSFLLSSYLNQREHKLNQCLLAVDPITPPPLKNILYYPSSLCLLAPEKNEEIISWVSSLTHRRHQKHPPPHPI